MASSRAAALPVDAPAVSTAQERSEATASRPRPRMGVRSTGHSLEKVLWDVITDGKLGACWYPNDKRVIALYDGPLLAQSCGRNSWSSLDKILKNMAIIHIGGPKSNRWSQSDPRFYMYRGPAQYRFDQDVYMRMPRKYKDATGKVCWRDPKGVKRAAGPSVMHAGPYLLPPEDTSQNRAAHAVKKPVVPPAVMALKYSGGEGAPAVPELAGSQALPLGTDPVPASADPSAGAGTVSAAQPAVLDDADAADADAAAARRVLRPRSAKAAAAAAAVAESSPSDTLESPADTEAERSAAAMPASATAASRRRAGGRLAHGTAMRIPDQMHQSFVRTIAAPNVPLLRAAPPTSNLGPEAGKQELPLLPLPSVASSLAASSGPSGSAAAIAAYRRNTAARGTTGAALSRAVADDIECSSSDDDDDNNDDSKRMHGSASRNGNRHLLRGKQQQRGTKRKRAASLDVSAGTQAGGRLKLQASDSGASALGFLAEAAEVLSQKSDAPCDPAVFASGTTASGDTTTQLTTQGTTQGTTQDSLSALDLTPTPPSQAVPIGALDIPPAGVASMCELAAIESDNPLLVIDSQGSDDDGDDEEEKPPAKRRALAQPSSPDVAVSATVAAPVAAPTPSAAEGDDHRLSQRLFPPHPSIEEPSLSQKLFAGLPSGGTQSQTGGGVTAFMSMTALSPAPLSQTVALSQMQIGATPDLDPSQRSQGGS